MIICVLIHSKASLDTTLVIEVKKYEVVKEGMRPKPRTEELINFIKKISAEICVIRVIDLYTVISVMPARPRRN